MCYFDPNVHIQSVPHSRDKRNHIAYSLIVHHWAMEDKAYTLHIGLQPMPIFLAFIYSNNINWL